MKTSEILTLKNLYTSLDQKQLNMITYEDVLAYLNETPSLFTTKLFELIDREQKGLITWNQFFQLTCHFCTLCDDDILLLIFNMFDDHNREYLEEEQFLKLLTVLNRDTVFPDTFQDAIKEFDSYCFYIFNNNNNN